MPREAEWSLGVAAVFWVYYNKNIFKDPFGRHVHYRGALYNKDMKLKTGTYIGSLRLGQYRDLRTIHTSI